MANASPQMILGSAVFTLAVLPNVILLKSSDMSLMRECLDDSQFVCVSKFEMQCKHNNQVLKMVLDNGEECNQNKIYFQ